MGLFSQNFNTKYMSLSRFSYMTNIHSMSDVVMAQLMNVLPSACRPSFVPQSHKNVTIKGLVRKILIYHLHKKFNYQHQWKTKTTLDTTFMKKSLVNMISKRCHQIIQCSIMLKEVKLFLYHSNYAINYHVAIWVKRSKHS